jgi:hypothetical protein
MSQRLPSLPNLEHLRKQAKDVLRVARRRSPDWRLVDAQQALARGYGFSTWADLKVYIESARPDRTAAPTGDDGQSAPAVTGRLDKNTTAPRADDLMVGTWVSHQESGPVLFGTITLGVERVDDTLLFTQIAVDTAGRDVANRLAIQIDGQKHPIPFGDRMFLSASWHHPRRLVTRAIQDDRVLAEGLYEVSEDGGSLRVATARQSIVFERV